MSNIQNKVRAHNAIFNAMRYLVLISSLLTVFISSNVMAKEKKDSKYIDIKASSYSFLETASKVQNGITIVPKSWGNDNKMKLLPTKNGLSVSISF